MPAADLRGDTTQRELWLHPSASPRVLALGAAVLVVCVAVRFIGIGEESFWCDEEWSREVANLVAAHEVVGVCTPNYCPPAYYLVLRYWRMLVGDSDIALRSLSALIGIAVVVSGAMLAARLWGARVALVAGACLALSADAVRYSQETRHYAMLALAGVGLVWSALVVLCSSSGILCNLGSRPCIPTAEKPRPPLLGQ